MDKNVCFVQNFAMKCEIQLSPQTAWMSPVWEQKGKKHRTTDVQNAPISSKQRSSLKRDNQVSFLLPEIDKNIWKKHNNV